LRDLVFSVEDAADATQRKKMRQGVCAVALAYAANPSFGASRRQDVINHAWRRRRPSVSIEEEDPGGLGCNFFFSKGLLCNLGMYCALSLIPPFLSQKKENVKKDVSTK